MECFRSAHSIENASASATSSAAQDIESTIGDKAVRVSKLFEFMILYSRPQAELFKLAAADGFNDAQCDEGKNAGSQEHKAHRLKTNHLRGEGRGGSVGWNPYDCFALDDAVNANSGRNCCDKPAENLEPEGWNFHDVLLDYRRIDGCAEEN